MKNQNRGARRVCKINDQRPTLIEQGNIMSHIVTNNFLKSKRYTLGAKLFIAFVLIACVALIKVMAGEL